MLKPRLIRLANSAIVSMVTTGKYGIFTPSALKDPGGGFFHPAWMRVICPRRGVGLRIIYSNIQSTVLSTQAALRSRPFGDAGAARPEFSCSTRFEQDQ
ncbi:MAG TPA: hypothetical protein VF429_04765 [Anaerolineae bacterium]